MDFKCDELILGKKDADSRALTRMVAWEEHRKEQCIRRNALLNFRRGTGRLSGRQAVFRRSNWSG
jgi:hypothetical protein